MQGIFESDFKFEVGKIFYTCANRGFYKNYVVAIVEGMIVYKYYGKHKQWWHYEVRYPRPLDMEIQLTKKQKLKSNTGGK